MAKKPHKFTIGEGYGIWSNGKKTYQHFPRTFLRKKGGDSAGKFDPGGTSPPGNETKKERANEHSSKRVGGDSRCP